MHSLLPPPAYPDARHWEWQYLDLMRRIWSEGDERADRTGVGTRSIFGPQLRIDLADDRVPLLTTKRVYWKAAAREMLWFLSGETNIRPLLQQGVTIWSDWPLARYRRDTGDAVAQEVFERRIVEDAAFAARWGDLGPVYGKQWVDWPTYTPQPDGSFRNGAGINQVALLIDGLQRDPGGRRHIIEGWNVAELHRMALPPCHKTYQFHVAGGRLSCQLYQRSCDVALGLGYSSGVTRARRANSKAKGHYSCNDSVILSDCLDVVVNRGYGLLRRQRGTRGPNATSRIPIPRFAKPRARKWGSAQGSYGDRNNVAFR
jgi:thymidylate synthase